MVAPTAAHGLSTTDLEKIREALTSGRRPRVVFTASAGQVAGEVGQVVGMTDPDGSDEWIVVRFGHDELPFSPTDLTIPPRSTPVRRTQPRQGPAFTTNDAPSELPGPREEPTRSTSIVDTPPTVSPAGDGRTDAVPRENGSARRPSKAPRPRLPATLTVTLAYAQREWTIAANHGSRVLAKPYVIKPTDALRLVALIDAPGVHDAVQHIIAAERAEAEVRAQRLRAELAEIEARLSDLTQRS